MDLIDKEQWSSLSADVKGDAYEGLLQKNAEDVKGGAGQYFTPRPLIAAMVDVVAPQPGQAICDPACGTGGFLLAAHDYLAKHYQLDRAQKKRLKNGTLFGIELVDSVTRLCAMNLLLHGIGESGSDVSSLNQEDKQRRDASATLSATFDLPVVTKDALAGKHGEYEIVLANPPFGKKSSVTIVNEAGESSKESLIINRDDFWASTSNKQLNFLQHIFTILKSLSGNWEGCCGEGFWLGARRSGRSIPAAGCDDRDNDAQRQKNRRPEGFRGKGRLASLLVGQRPMKGILPPRASPSSLCHENSTSPNLQTGSGQHGRAAVVLPDNVLFEGGAGETIRRELLKQADVHTLLRLPTGIFYAHGGPSRTGHRRTCCSSTANPRRKSRGRRNSGFTTCARTNISRSRKTPSSAVIWMSS